MHGILDLRVLSVLAEQRDQGAGLAEQLSRSVFGDISGGTLYTSLLRSETRGLVRTMCERPTFGARSAPQAL